MSGAAKKKTAAVLTLGCKVNDVESGSLISGLKALGYEVSNKHGYADLYIVNTCAVTAEAERKSRQAVGRALKDNPNAKVIVCGCASQNAPEDFSEKEGVICVFGAKSKQRILSVAAEDFSPLAVQRAKENDAFQAETYEEAPRPESMKTRNFVKIQDGCNRFCSYCLIPYLRGRSRSRTIESAAAEINESTAYETVITGIDVSDYRDGDKDICDLLYAVKDAPTRIRFSSIEESMITPRFLQTAKQLKNFAPQFHLSLQSGSDAVLKAMNRKYTRAEYLEKCRMIYDAFDNAAITTDIIVGFPTETEEDFRQSLSIVSEANFLQVHAFPYSPRKGTLSAKRYTDLPAPVKKERLSRMLAAAAAQKEKYLTGCIGKTYLVIPETKENGEYCGHAETYAKVYIKGLKDKTPVRAKAVGLYKDGLLGEPTE
ncbi:MAG: tRNA (N(6)-L-threonylcarbamoyladenosine(37)-C(2))-methylthiotransferase MtaB [Clostridia bacterium]|nr:tRNA (N(6)-L-threonylcarbamoyladenosine(37)-C(2))-methylthiotransferase MtaB [Clostridia bacterium]